MYKSHRGWSINVRPIIPTKGIRQLCKVGISTGSHIQVSRIKQLTIVKDSIWGGGEEVLMLVLVAYVFVCYGIIRYSVINMYVLIVCSRLTHPPPMCAHLHLSMREYLTCALWCLPPPFALCYLKSKGGRARLCISLHLSLVSPSSPLLPQRCHSFAWKKCNPSL